MYSMSFAHLRFARKSSDLIFAGATGIRRPKKRPDLR
ncbi:hypothetical protein SAMN05216368_10319 [Cryobacterium flavum]|uniref:Uncharacterized protein n=1 Tax=Cryobacterium flavum TaxID=1424659 RepID=A0A5E9GS11_9MICO|nr:hypothetical protein SAMN05216368_10319 [Cryobacterium flavum]